MEYGAIQRIAEEFWAAAVEKEPFPRVLESVILWTLPLAVFKLPRLYVSDVQQWLAGNGIRFQLQSTNRSLHACLFASHGRGCVLLNGADGFDESRFSLAHETAHFLLDYHRPRQRAVSRLGPQIIEVFDGQRSPSSQERVHAILSHVPIGFHAHLMEREGDGLMGCGATSEIEAGTDTLALELLAPRAEVRRRVGKVHVQTPDQDTERVAIQVLLRDFGLPHMVAAAYATHLYPKVRSRSVREWLRQRS